MSVTGVNRQPKVLLRSKETVVGLLTETPALGAARLLEDERQRQRARKTREDDKHLTGNDSADCPGVFGLRMVFKQVFIFDMFRNALSTHGATPLPQGILLVASPGVFSVRPSSVAAVRQSKRA